MNNFTEYNLFHFTAVTERIFHIIKCCKKSWVRWKLKRTCRVSIQLEESVWALDTHMGDEAWTTVKFLSQACLRPLVFEDWLKGVLVNHIIKQIQVSSWRWSGLMERGWTLWWFHHLWLCGLGKIVHPFCFLICKRRVITSAFRAVVRIRNLPALFLLKAW